MKIYIQTKKFIFTYLGVQVYVDSHTCTPTQQLIKMSLNLKESSEGQGVWEGLNGGKGRGGKQIVLFYVKDKRNTFLNIVTSELKNKKFKN